MCLAVFAVVRAADSDGHYGGGNSERIPSFVSIAVIKYDDKNQLWEERSLLQLTIQVHCCGEVKAGVWTSWSHHIHNQETRMHAHSLVCNQLNFFTLITVQDPCLENSAAHSGWGLPHIN